MKALFLALASIGALLATPAHAATLDGASLNWPWVLPFAGILLSIATGPLLYPVVWEHHHGKIVAAWAGFTVLALFTSADPSAVAATVSHAVLVDYAPFVLLLLALFTTAGGLYLKGNLHDSVLTNTVLLGIGAMLASVVGTTGASMILIRPVLRANDDRLSCVHVVVFFIFLVSNIGGVLTPLGDPPLFLGFLRGVDFFWTARHLALPTLVAVGLVLAIFAAIDIALHRRDDRNPDRRDPTPDAPLRLYGTINLALIGGVIAAILLSATWKPGIAVTIVGTSLELQNIVRDLTMIAVTLLSIRLTSPADRLANGFTWTPIREVAILFAGIFICIAPVMAMLQAGPRGAFAPLVALVNAGGDPNPSIYFWLTGLLSSFLDNAPTYLVFFELAGGDARTLMTSGAKILAAISSGAVFMGAMTYIGNAPNFIVYAVARENGVKMPNFFAYIVWSGLVLLPVFALVQYLFFR